MSKYHATPCVVDGVRFASKAEAKRWQELTLLQKAGYIRDLRRQVAFELLGKQKKPNGGTERAINYYADFTYFDVCRREFIIEDVKSVATRGLPAYIMKRKLLLKMHGLVITEVTR